MSKSVLVVGGGIAGIQASLDLANRGTKVFLVEENPSIGGHMAQLDKTFPTLDCSICILAPKMIECFRHNNINLLTYSEVKEVRGQAGDFTVKILKKPRFVDKEKCTGCGKCTEVCPVTSANEFDTGLGMRNAIYRPFAQAVPNVFVIEKRGTPHCRAACPAGVNAQGYIALISKGKFDEALELIRRDIPFVGVCGRICFHPCESDCERGKVDEPLAIRALKRFVSDYELKNGEKKAVTALPKTHKEKIAIIGSGPAGLTAAYALVKKGYPVTVFESLPKPGGMLRVGIPEYRLPRDILDADINHVKSLGVKIRTNMSIGKQLLFNELMKKYDATFVASGMHKGSKLGIEGEELKGVVNAIDFLRDVNLGKKVELGPKVAIICVHRLLAIDAARVALRLGCRDVNVIYRRSRNSMLSHEKIGEQLRQDIEMVEKEGVKIQFQVWPTRILGKNGRVVGVEFVKMGLGEPDESGKRRLVPVKGSEFVMELESVILAVGQAPDFSFLPKEVELTEKGTVKVDPVTLETSLPGVFAGGEVESGPSTAIASMAAGKKAAVSIDRYLRGEDLKAGRDEEIKLAEEVPKEHVEKKARQAIPVLPVEKTIDSFVEVEGGFTEEMALEEAKRCLNCGGCSECFECEKACEPKAVSHDQKEEVMEVNVGAIIFATGFIPSDPSAIKAYGYGVHKNVLDSMNLERLLSASGPTGGHLIRPSDGKEPRSVVFVQCVGSRSLHGGFPFCSTVCCVYATKESIIIKEHAPETKINIMYIDMRAVGKGFQEFVDRARDQYDVQFIKAHPGSIIEDPATKNLQINYEDTKTGEMKELNADIVVLCPALIPRTENQKLAKEAGIELDEAGFFKAKDLLMAPLDTTSAGIYACGYCQSPKDIPESVAQASGAAARAAEMIALTTKRESIEQQK